MGILTDVMVDLETWGTSPGCAFRSVGAVFFDPETGELGDEFYANVSESSCKKLKMHRDQSTVEWWAKPENALANKQLAADQMPVLDVLDSFAKFWRRGRAIHFWSQGANFDEPLLGWAYRAAGLKAPWEYHKAQDTRTAYRIAGFNPFTIKRQGTYHNALDDAKHQVVCVSLSFKKVRGKLV